MTETLQLTGRLDLPAAGPLHDQLGPMIGKSITLDMASVSHIGALCLQTLIAASRATQAQGGTLDLINTPDQLIAQLSAMGSSPEQISKGQK